MELTSKDLDKLEYILDKIKGNTACSFDKPKCVENLESIINPKCAVCRNLIEDNMVIINERKLHDACKSKYRIPVKKNSS